MSQFSRNAVVLSFSLVSTLLISCGSRSSANSKINTVVGRGGALFDKRVQVINALPNLAAGTTCLYLSEYDKSKAPHFSDHEANTAQPNEFLMQAERDARPVTQYPVSIAELDHGLAQKDVERKMRGILLIPIGIANAYFGFGLVAVGISWAGAAAVFSHPMGYSWLLGGLGGVGLLNQATRDLNSKNYGLRVNDATANTSANPSSTNLGVTLAYINVAKSLPAASNQACPSNLTSESLQPYFHSIQEQYNALSDGERNAASSNALANLRNTQGCHFATNVGDEKLIYQALPLDSDVSTLRLQTYQVKPNVGMQLISDEELKLQLKSDANSGTKYIADNERGSVAIWLTSSSNGKPVTAKLAHKLPSGEYVGHQTHISGSCQL